MSRSDRHSLSGSSSATQQTKLTHFHKPSFPQPKPSAKRPSPPVSRSQPPPPLLQEDKATKRPPTAEKHRLSTIEEYVLAKVREEARRKKHRQNEETVRLSKEVRESGDALRKEMESRGAKCLKTEEGYVCLKPSPPPPYVHKDTVSKVIDCALSVSDSSTVSLPFLLSRLRMEQQSLRSDKERMVFSSSRPRVEGMRVLEVEQESPLYIAARRWNTSLEENRKRKHTCKARMERETCRSIASSLPPEVAFEAHPPVLLRTEKGEEKVYQVCKEEKKLGLKEVSRILEEEWSSCVQKSERPKERLELLKRSVLLRMEERSSLRVKRVYRSTA